MTTPVEITLDQLAERNRRLIRFDILAISWTCAFAAFSWFTLDGIVRTAFESIYAAVLVGQIIILTLNIRLRGRIANLREREETIEALNRWFRF